MSYRTHSEGSLYIYDNATATVIDAVDQYHSVQGLLEGSHIDGMTYLASSSGAITDTADNGGVLRCTDVAHGLTTGQYITLTGMGDAAHVGRTGVTVIDVDTFDCDDIAYNSDADTGNWQRGSSLTVDSGHGGDYDISFSMSMTSAGNNKNYKLEVSRNATALDEFAAERKVQTAGDLGSVAASGIQCLNSGDVIYLTIEGTTDATNMTVKHCNLHAHRS